MDIRNRRSVRYAASHALADNPGEPRKVVLAYILIMAISTLLVNVVVDLLYTHIAQATGLANMGSRAILTTIAVCLPIAQSVAMWYVQLGYQKTTVAMARRQAVAPRDLADGFRFFGPLLRAMLIQSVIYMAMGFVTIQVASVIFTMTPFAADFIELVSPMISDPEAYAAALMTDEALYNQVGMALLPLIPIWLVLFGVVAVPFFYSCRMVGYALLERPGTGALRAMGESGQMMKGNRMALFQVDLSYWWFYLAQFLLGGVLYGDRILAAMGVTLPWSGTVSYYVFSVLYFLLTGILFWFFLNKVETVYATCYDALRPQPRENHSGGAVLGNIFELAKDYHED